MGNGPDFLRAFESEKQPTLCVDGERMGLMKRTGSKGPLAYYGKLRTGTSDFFCYMVDGKRIGGFSEKMVHTSKIYDGMKSDYRVHVPAQYSPPFRLRR